MGKYDDHVASLPKEDPLEGKSVEYRERVAAHANLIRSAADFKQHASYLAGVYADIRREKAVVEEELSDINARLAAVEGMMFEQFEAEGTQRLVLTDGAAVSIGYDISAKVLDKEAFRVWCVDNGLERALQLWPSTTTAMCKERLLQGLPDPAGVASQARKKIRFSS